MCSVKILGIEKMSVRIGIDIPVLGIINSLSLIEDDFLR